ncbi:MULTISPECIES: hypothetical protein [Micromonospora]|uniref:Uncharacterized protein n=1 Tax=Micromonospora chalcea TaxID=1874 RepID=A0ABX9Y832_MICCH|nr:MULTISPECIES: hypothetical protein [Micromonospora]EWM68452.1 hypothetical protein MCBG_05586 [Micromonospora sp. M42]MBC8990612.1 hypothetical protein [Micromonospora chalcea]MBP1784726.1 hypothetical protein [Micromonospora sp. HB375]MBQ1065017.1 hypothetical protein [Micromonospora sp. C41]MBQ1067549.1 hypothetical protein [Micromonospora sp. D75]
MHVRLSASWTDPRGTVWAVGDTVDVDAVTLAELEEKGMVEQPAGSGSTETTTTTTTPPKKTDPSKIGPGPSAPPADSDKD